MSDKDKYKALRKRLGLKKNQLINTSRGALDVFKVEDGKVYYGFLIGNGGVIAEQFDDFLKRFEGMLSVMEI